MLPRTVAGGRGSAAYLRGDWFTGVRHDNSIADADVGMTRTVSFTQCEFDQVNLHFQDLVELGSQALLLQLHFVSLRIVA